LSSSPVPRTFIFGFDPATLDRSAPVNANGYRAVLPVGASVTLRAVRDANGEVTEATDTLRTVTWTLSDASSATLTPSADGSAQLVTTQVGRVGTISANGTSILYACATTGLRACSAVGAIDVVAR